MSIFMLTRLARRLKVGDKIKRYGRQRVLSHQSVGLGYKQVVLPAPIITALDLLKKELRGAMKNERKLSYREVIQSLIQHYQAVEPLRKELARKWSNVIRGSLNIVTDIDGARYLDIPIRYRLPLTEETETAMRFKYGLEEDQTAS